MMQDGFFHAVGKSGTAIDEYTEMKFPAEGVILMTEGTQFLAPAIARLTVPNGKDVVKSLHPYHALSIHRFCDTLYAVGVEDEDGSNFKLFRLISLADEDPYRIVFFDAKLVRYYPPEKDPFCGDLIRMLIRTVANST